MKCPHCDYNSGWDSEKMDFVRGKQGDFYRLPIRMERREYGDTEQISLFGCPSCSKTFIGEE